MVTFPIAPINPTTKVIVTNPEVQLGNPPLHRVSSQMAKDRVQPRAEQCFEACQG